MNIKLTAKRFVTRQNTCFSEFSPAINLKLKKFRKNCAKNIRFSSENACKRLDVTPNSPKHVNNTWKISRIVVCSSGLSSWRARNPYGYQKDRNRMGSEDLAVGEIARAKGGCSESNRSLERVLRRKIPQRRIRCRKISKSNRPVRKSLAIGDDEEQDPTNHTTNRRCIRAWLE